MTCFFSSNSQEECESVYFQKIQKNSLNWSADRLSFDMTARLSSLSSGHCLLWFCLSSVKSFSMTLLALLRLDLNLWRLPHLAHRCNLRCCSNSRLGPNFQCGQKKSHISPWQCNHSSTLKSHYCLKSGAWLRKHWLCSNCLSHSHLRLP